MLLLDSGILQHLIRQLKTLNATFELQILGPNHERHVTVLQPVDSSS